MVWENYGRGYKKDENGNHIKLDQWCIDHIVPVSKFNPNEENVDIKINHYTNLRPMWNSDNSKKLASLDKDIENRDFFLKYKNNAFK